MPEADEEDSEEDSDEKATDGKQSFGSRVPKQSLGTGREGTAKTATKKLPFPSKLPDQVLAIRQQLAAASVPLSAAEMAKRFTKAKSDRIEELLLSLVTLGIARQVEGAEEKFVAA